MSKKKIMASRPPVPEGFAREMASLLGEEESVKLMDAIEDSPSVSIRVNRRKASIPVSGTLPDGMEPVPWCESGFYLQQRPDFILDPLLHAGVYYVQEAASMIYETLTEEIIRRLAAEGTRESELRILDLCAAPGGKSTAILNGVAAAEEKKGTEIDYLLVANEFDRKRVRILKENLDKWGDPNVIITNSSTGAFSRTDEIFDIVAVDAPCSGEGMMRREAVARTQWSQRLVEQCAALQADILSDAVEALRPGGYLIYSTCTFNDVENEGNVRRLVEEFGLEPMEEPRHFFPHRDRCEGLFAAVLRKPADDSAAGYPQRGNMAKILTGAGINILSAGTEMTVKKGNIEIPSPKQVLACNIDRSKFPMVELNRDEALSYLRRLPLSLPEGTPAGYVAVTFQGHPLGLVKNLGSRANNLLPPEWRVIKS